MHLLPVADGSLPLCKALKIDAMIKERKHYIVIAVVAIVLIIAVALAVFFLRPRQPETLQVTTTEAATTQLETEPVETTEIVSSSPVPLNPFTPDDFQYEGDYLICTAAESMIGVDVSSYQGTIDWQQVKAAGIEFAMIRIGGRGYGLEGYLYEDKMAYTNYCGAKEAGLLVGVYFFSQSITPDEAKEEARYALKLTEGWELDLPIVYDWEHIDGDVRTAYVNDWTLTSCTDAFCREIEAAGKQPMVYVSPWFGNLKLYRLNKYPQWIALYKDEMTYDYRFDMWQYTCTGSVPGIQGDVDLNVYIVPQT